MADSKMQLMVVTDLDGTLLDHHDYSFDPVLPILDRMDEEGIPMVVNTSKTKSEWLAMREAFGNDDPFIVENGSALYEGDEVTVFGTPREEILEKISPLRSQFKFTGYSDVDVEKIIAWTGLDRSSALRSSHRGYSEPLVWEDSPEAENEFCRKVADLGLKTLRGGRFLHVLGDTDKGKPLKKFQDAGYALIALGDRPNDLAMLTTADVGVIIASPGDYVLDAGEANDDLLRSEETGPRGWAEMMTLLLDHFLKKPAI